MTNNSGIYPIRDLVLLKPDEKVESKEGVIIVPESAKSREQLAQIFGVVVAVGESAYKYEEINYKTNTRDKIVPGTRVLFAKYAGIQLPGIDGVSYRVVNDNDITAIVDEAVKKDIEL